MNIHLPFCCQSLNGISMVFVEIQWIVILLQNILHFVNSILFFFLSLPSAYIWSVLFVWLASFPLQIGLLERTFRTMDLQQLRSHWRWHSVNTLMITEFFWNLSRTTQLRDVLSLWCVSLIHRRHEFSTIFFFFI